MSKSAHRTSPAFVGFIALTGIILSGSPTRAGDECLAAPNSSAPPGSHWHYHVDRSTQRKCWYVRLEDQQASAEKSAAATETGATVERTRISRQTERAHTRPATVSDNTQAEAPASQTSEPVAATSPTPGVAEEQPASFDKPDLPTMPSPTTSNSGTSASMVENSGPASAVSFNEDASPAQSQPTTTDPTRADSSPQAAVYRADAATMSTADQATFTPMRVLLLIPAALALTGVLAFAVVPSRLRQQVYARRWGLSSAASDTIAKPDRPAPQVEIPDECKQNLRQVLQTLEAQLRGDAELEEVLAQRRSRKPAWG